jgi:hypothetical protein
VLAQEAIEPEKATGFGQPLRRLVANCAIRSEQLGRGLALVQVFLGGGTAGDAQDPNANRRAKPAA